jgi:hypothetical protein
MFIGAPGSRVGNGAIILDQRIVGEKTFEVTGNHRIMTIVLAMKDYPAGPEPFVTWSRWVTFKRLPDRYEKIADDCSWGHYYTNLRRAVEDFDIRVEAITHEKANAEAIRARGEVDGKTAAEWFFNGPIDIGTSRRFLQGIEDGDPEYMDELPRPMLSGEYADVPTWEDIVRDETNIEELSDDGEIELLDIYEQAFRDAVQDLIVTRLKSHLEVDDD